VPVEQAGGGDKADRTVDHHSSRRRCRMLRTT
jgi:hypothetical protein